MAGVVVEELDSAWVAFSPLSVQTSVLNAESAAILGFLQYGPRDSRDVALELSAELGLALTDIESTVQTHWQQLADAGLVRFFDTASR